MKKVFAVLFIFVCFNGPIALNGINVGNKDYKIGNNISDLVKEEKQVNIYGKEFKSTDTTIDLSDIAIDSNLGEYLKSFNNLEEVNIKNNNVTADDILKLKESFRETRFIFDLQYLDLTIDSNVENLELINRKDLVVEDLRKVLSVLDHLVYLDLSDCNLTNEVMAELREEFPSVKIAWRLYLGKWTLKTDDTSFSVLIGRIDYERMTSEDIEVLKYTTDLQALDLGHQAITDISVIGDYLKELRILILADNKITNIEPLKELKHLHYLELFVNEIHDMSPLAELNELIDINIGYNPIDTIEPLLNFKHLERVWIVCGRLSEADRVVLKNAYPNATVNTAWALSSTQMGWRTHSRYYAMKDMYNNVRYMNEEFSKYDNID